VSLLSKTDLQVIAVFATSCIEPGDPVTDTDVDEAWRTVFEPQKRRVKLLSKAERTALVKAMRAELERLARERAEPAPECGVKRAVAPDGSKLRGADATPCRLAAGHDGPHEGGAPEGNHVTSWEGNGKRGAIHTPIRPNEESPLVAAPPVLEVIAGRQIHPAASRFPMMDEAELQEFAADIKANGQRLPILEHMGMILDGRNRLRACEIAGVEPRINPWDGKGGSPTAFVISINLKRRHLNESQRAVLVAQLLPLFEAEAKQRQLSGLKRGDVSPLAPRGANGERAPKAAAHAAVSANVGTRSVERAKAVIARSPATAERVLAGDVTLKQAERELRKGEQVAAIREYVPPQGTYSVIACDPPWQFDTRAEDDTHRGRVTYPPMSTDAICALDVGRTLADDDCILALWCTNAHLADGSVAKVLAAWGFTSKTIHTWIKTTGDAETVAQLEETSPQFGVGNYGRGGTEHYVIAVRGNPVCDWSSMVNWFAAPRREHSRKPEAFYARMEKACPAPMKLEMFAREHRSGWHCAGAEVDQFDERRTA
jgi:N6-adenosine-specific RNA methylase IME4